MNVGRIVVSYVGVHQAYQLALAAQELGELKAFYCGLYDAPRKWGSLAAKIVGHEALTSRRVDGLHLDKIIEFPWPLIWKRARDRFYQRGKDEWLPTFNAFDRWVARRLEKSLPEIFVGTAGSDLHCLELVKRGGKTVVHDCPGLHPLSIANLASEAADRAGIKRRGNPAYLAKWDARLMREYPLADILLLYSELHLKSFESAGYPRERLVVSPLWIDTHLWYRDAPKNSERTASNDPIKLLFVGSISLLKGIPFLLKAVVACGNAVQLTMVGPRDSETDVLVGPEKHNVRYLPPQSKSKLRKIYSSHDVLVMPSVGDSFGFVAFEAMACGLPAIVTENCGVPVPDSSWRVRAMDSEALANRIMQYVDNRMLIADHGKKAISFAAQFTPEKYRQGIQSLFNSILAKA